VTKPKPDLSPLLPDDVTLKARRAALIDSVSRGAGRPRPKSSWRRHRLRLALGSAVALAAVAAALILSASGDSTSKAFAVVPREGGGVTIKIFSLEDASGLEQALEDAGIRAQVNWLPAGTVCREPHYTPSRVHIPGGGTMGGMSMGGPGVVTIGVGSTKSYRESFGKLRRGELSQSEIRDSVANINLDPAAFRPDQSVVLTGSPVPYNGDPEGGSITKFDVAKGTVKPCEPVPAPPGGNNPYGLPGTGGGPDYIPQGDRGLGRAAAAAYLHHAADAARASDAHVDGPPGQGQFLYTRTIEAHLEAWDPDGRPSGSRSKPRYFTDRQLGSETAMPALLLVTKEVWTARDGTTRERETLDRVDFLANADQRRWERAGSPPPFEFDPAEHDVSRDGAGRLVKDFRARAFRGKREFKYLAKLSRLPTDPEALRLAIENRDNGGGPVDPSPAGTQRGGATVETLLEILREPLASASLRAAAFDALAEIPGIGFERGVTDATRRRGDAIGWTRERGFGRRVIFDPHTSRILAEAEMIFGPPSTDENGAPAGTPFRETAYRRSAIVNSTRERRGAPATP
jgi:hypothetical protein